MNENAIEENKLAKQNSYNQFVIVNFISFNQPITQSGLQPNLHQSFIKVLPCCRVWIALRVK